MLVSWWREASQQHQGLICALKLKDKQKQHNIDLTRVTDFFYRGKKQTQSNHSRPKRRRKRLTIQREHRGKVFTVGDSSWVSDAGLPKVGPVRGRGDDCSIKWGNLPVVCRQGGRHEHPPRSAENKSQDLLNHAAHTAQTSPPHRWGTAREAGETSDEQFPNG